MKKLFLLAAVVLSLCVLAGCGEAPAPTDPTSTTTQTQPQTQPETESTLEYTWDVTIAYCNFDVHEHGEAVPAVTLANAGAKDQELHCDASGLTEEELRVMLDEENRLLFSGVLTVTDPSSEVVEDTTAWTLEDGGAGVALKCEVITPLTEGDGDTHGELLMKLVAPDYIWNIEIVYENGACGRYEFTNPGLSGWESYGEQYMNQVFTATPEQTTAQLLIFNHQDWIVDNTRSWYKWVVFDVDDECPDITYEIVESLTMGDRKTPGKLKITISLP